MIISHSSALDYWRDAGPNALGAAKERQNCTCKAQYSFARLSDFTLKQAQRTSGAVGCSLDVRHAGLLGCKLPVHQLIPTPQLRSRTTDLVSHVWSSPLPSSSIVCASMGLYVTTPEFSLLQIAEKTDLLKLIFLFHEFCGTYALTADGYLSKRESPLTTTKKLEAFFIKNSQVGGSRKALRALRYTLDNSASPMEIALAMLLCLPYKLGGYGLPRPLLNHRIDLPKTYLDKAQKQFYICDFYWPDAKLAVEYDSDAYHTQAQKITADALRRNDLESVGVSVITVTARQVFDRVRLETLAYGLAGRLGKRIKCDKQQLIWDNGTLRHELHNLVNRMQ